MNKKTVAFYDITNILNSLPEEDRAEVANEVASRWAANFIWDFDYSDGQGKVGVHKGSQGVWLNFPEVLGEHGQACMADLFYRSEDGEGIHPGKPYSLKVYSADDIDDPAYEELY